MEKRIKIQPINKLSDYRKKNLMTILNWRNETSTRINFLNQNIIDLNQHKKWIKNLRKNPNNKIYIFYKSKTPIGVCYIINKKKKYYLSYSIDKKFRNRGYGGKMLKLFFKKINKKFYKNKIFATVLPKNKKSIKILIRQNFFITNKNSRFIQICFSN